MENALTTNQPTALGEPGPPDSYRDQTEQAKPLEAAPEIGTAAREWLQALPNYPDTTDLFTLNEDNFAVKVIRELLDKPAFEIEIQANYPASNWLVHFYFESKNRERVFGSKHLGIGYPYVLAERHGQRLAAPLFFWQLGIEPHAKTPDNWTIQRSTASHAVVPNHALFYWIDKVYGTDFSERARRLTHKKHLKTSDLADFTEALKQFVGLTEHGLPLSVLPSPGPNDTELYTRQGLVHWSGVIGIFPSLPMDVAAQPPHILHELSGDLGWKHTFSMLPMDPSQRAVLQSVHENAVTVVEGASGTGKTYMISNIVINALSNGKKCLVVSHNINALRRAQKFLLDSGFGDLSFIVRDLAADQLMLADMLRAAATNPIKPKFDETEFKTILHRSQRETKKLDDAWRDLHAQTFGEMSFVDTVGRFLRTNRAEGKELLHSQLNPADYQFSREEFEEIMVAIRASEPLFRKFPTLDHPLTCLDSALFSENDGAAGLDLAKQKVQRLLEKSTALHHRYIAKTSDYAEALTDHYEQHFADLAAHLKRVTNALEDGKNRFGDEFEKASGTGDQFNAMFSGKAKEMLAAKEGIGQKFMALRQVYLGRKYFDFDFPGNLDLRNIKKISELTHSFDLVLKNWRKRIPATVREDLRRLNSKTLHFDLDFKDAVRDLETGLDDFLADFNAAKLFAEPTKHEMLTIPKRQEFLEEQLARLEETQFYLRDYPDFHVWQKHWLALSPQAQKAVRGLSKTKPRNWAAAFESWYLHHLLQLKFSQNLVWDNETLENWSEAFVELRRALPFQISALWMKRKIAALTALKKENSAEFKTWFGQDNRKLVALRRPEEIFEKHINALTETLPVLLVTPQVALEVVKSANMLFDLVLVDEGHNVMKQKGYHLFDMAKNVVLFGDSKQDMTPFAEDDILEFCKSTGAKPYLLDYQHQYCPEEWIDFNKVAFGTPFKRLPFNLAGKDVTTVVNVEGRYDEATKTNEAEARQIIDWLNMIEQTPAKNYPVVGIACATEQQRDLIAGQLLRIRQTKAPGHEKIQQLHLSGMGVYQFGELQGQHVDVLLLSLTHGLTNVSGRLTDELHFWNTPLGINQLHVALTRATQRMFIAHSIPPGLHAVLAADKMHRGTCILSHLVRYDELVERGEAEAAAEQLETMKAQLEYPAIEYPPNIFMEEVEIALQPYFEPGRIQRNATVRGITVPLLIASSGPGQPDHILLFDGVLAKTAMPSYEWEAKLGHYFRQHGVDCVPTLSVNWWKAPKQEARKLAARIISKEAKVEG